MQSWQLDERMGCLDSHDNPSLCNSHCNSIEICIERLDQRYYNPINPTDTIFAFMGLLGLKYLSIKLFVQVLGWALKTNVAWFSEVLTECFYNTVGSWIPLFIYCTYFLLLHFTWKIICKAGLKSNHPVSLGVRKNHDVLSWLLSQCSQATSKVLDPCIYFCVSQPAVFSTHNFFEYSPISLHFIFFSEYLPCSQTFAVWIKSCWSTGHIRTLG